MSGTQSSRHYGLPTWLSGKESPVNAGDTDSTPGSGRSPGGGNGNPLQYFAWKIPWTGESGGLQSTGSQSDMTEHARTHTLLDIVPLIGFSWSCLLGCAKGDYQARLMWLPALLRGSM